MGRMIQPEDAILVTGAAGFIGSCLVKRLNEKGYTNLFLVDNLYDSIKWKNLVGKQFQDLLPKEDLFSFLKQERHSIKAVMHLGACSNTQEKDCDYLLDNNYRYTITLAKLCLDNDIRLVYASSAGTYGDGKQGFSDTEEITRFQPLTMYAYSKHLVDLWMQKQQAFDQVAALKYFNVFGPNEYHKKDMASMICKMTRIIQEKSSIQLFKSTEPLLYADGEQKRDFIYVKDAVEMTLYFLLKTQKGGIYNVGRGEAVTWNTLAQAIFKALKKKPHVEYIPMPHSMVKGYQNYTCADPKKWQTLMQAQKHIFPLSPIEDSVEDYVQNYLIHESFF